ncbi:hypothetical protein [Curtobacterium sp. P97]|uniref:hypothetical protein n=1 Tax=unclassified Curtobacterium TaxID=257496 RepID=UPI002040C374|nr:hypothetical protein [Curtobacterium sp. P97]
MIGITVLAAALALVPTAMATAATDEQPGSPVGSTRTIAKAPTGVGLTPLGPDRYQVTGQPHCGVIEYTCQIHVGNVGPTSSSDYHWDGGTSTAEFDGWGYGETRTPTYWTYACSVFGCKNSATVTAGSATRPFPQLGITARVQSKNDTNRSAVITGTATGRAVIKRGGAQVATATSDRTGTWSATVTGLSTGQNRITFQQWVDGRYRDETSVVVDFPPTPGQIVGDTGTADLQRGATTPVSVSYTAKSAFHTPTGKLVVTAPEGTTFAPGQDRQRGEYLEGGTWHRFGGDSLVDGSRAADGRTYTFQLGNRDWDVAKDQRFRFTLDVQTPADVATTTSGMTGKLTGSFPGASFDTTATTATTVVDQALTARVESQDEVTRTATLTGTAPRRADSLDVTWERDGGTVTRTVTPSDGAWRFVVDGLRVGDTAVEVVAKVGEQAIGDPVSVTVHLDAAPFDATARFEDDVTKPVVIEGSGTAGGTVTLEGVWTTVQPVEVGGDGHWSVTVPAPDQPGKQAVTAVQTIGGQPAGSEQVEVDYGRAVRITSPGDGFAITPGYNRVRVSGNAEPHAQVRLGEGDDDAAYGSVTADADGHWAITTPALALRDHDLVATALSKGANTTRDTVRIVPEG